MASREPLFWCVWCEGGGDPTVKHPGYHDARAEAQRLARANPGKRFVVMAAAVAFVKRDLDEVQYAGGYELGEDEIPF